ncbi:hypothetical protein A2U01_0040354 [Trifolium medium]|uniref:Uncharacterized protein n=1 Tax=Trifolium medium TaxID=97028 RepID=A0A392Q508_9FABA|nr:hypothetical protein [Trifolium medium]
MARTKEQARKLIHDRRDSSPSKSSSRSPPKSPSIPKISEIATDPISPPPPPTQNAAAPIFTPSTINMQIVTVAETPNPSQPTQPTSISNKSADETTPIKKSTFPIKRLGTRKSARLMMGNKKPIVDTRVHSLDTDSDNTLSDHENPEPMMIGILYAFLV